MHLRRVLWSRPIVIGFAQTSTVPSNAAWLPCRRGIRPYAKSHGVHKFDSMTAYAGSARGEDITRPILRLGANERCGFWEVAPGVRAPLEAVERASIPTGRKVVVSP